MTEKKSNTRNRFSPETRSRAVDMLMACESEHSSRWAATQSVAAKFGCTPETLRTWTNQVERDTGKRDGMTSDEKARMKELEREVKELRMANEILRKASAYFAMAELDRPKRK